MFTIKWMEIRSSVVGIATMLRAGWSQVRMPVGDKLFFSYAKRADRLWGPPGLIFGGYLYQLTNSWFLKHDCAPWS